MVVDVCVHAVSRHVSVCVCIGMTKKGRHIVSSTRHLISEHAHVNQTCAANIPVNMTNCPPQTNCPPLALIAEFVKTPPQGYDEEATGNNTVTVK